MIVPIYLLFGKNDQITFVGKLFIIKNILYFILIQVYTWPRNRAYEERFTNILLFYIIPYNLGFVFFKYSVRWWQKVLCLLSDVMWSETLLYWTTLLQMGEFCNILALTRLFRILVLVLVVKRDYSQHIPRQHLFL